MVVQKLMSDMNIKRNLNNMQSKYQRGAILVEFVFVMPIVLVLILGGFEMARYIRVHQIAHKISYEMANVLLRTCVNAVSTEYGDQRYRDLQNKRTAECYNSVFEDYKKKQSVVLGFGNNMLNNPYSINSVMVNNLGNVNFCRGVETRASVGAKETDTGLIESTPSNPLTPGRCFLQPIVTGGILSPNPENNRPNPGNFDSVVQRVSGTDVVGAGNVAIWTEVSIAYSPVIQKLLLPFIGFTAGGDDGSVNNVTATAVTY